MWDPPEPGIEPVSPALAADSLPLSHQRSPLQSLNSVRNLGGHSGMKDTSARMTQDRATTWLKNNVHTTPCPLLPGQIKAQDLGGRGMDIIRRQGIGVPFHRVSCVSLKPLFQKPWISRDRVLSLDSRTTPPSASLLELHKALGVA